ncbi:MAG: Riboflavin kinase [Acidimicrobiaceae bacterium]|nr:Riboflavin kinase [Acidimicrobiaceae bacterium]
MLILRDDDTATSAEPSVVALGVFDGLHRGHQAVIELVVSLARTRDARAAVVTFDPVPAVVLAPTKAPRLLATLEQRLEGLAALGIDVVRVLTFTKEMAAESAEDFIDRVLVREMRALCVVVGEDFRFGHDRRGNVSMLRELGPARGFEVVAAPLFGEGERWSSTSVRQALERGDLEGASRVLARPFSLRADVEHGDQRGKSLGFPTANLTVSPSQELPCEGVYAGAARVDDRWWPAAISIGTRPQFYENGELLVEVHLVGFTGNLYGQSIDVVFLERLRGESVFADAEELTRQIARDVTKTQEIFDGFSDAGFQLLE